MGTGRAFTVAGSRRRRGRCARPGPGALQGRILLRAALALTLVLAPRVHAQVPDSVAGGPYVVVHWPEQVRLAERILEVARDQRPLSGLPPDALPGGAVTIVLAPGPALWDSVTGGAVPEWAAGIAVPALGRVVLPTFAWERMSNAQLYTTLRHELAHVALHRWLAPSRIPRWFDEGYARWAAGEWSFDAVWQLRLAFLLRRTPPLERLTLDWPSAQPDARLAYLLATSAVAHLMRLSGERGLEVLLRRWRETGSFDDALRLTLGMTPGQFEESWIDAVENRYAWPVFLAHSVVFWLFAGVILVALFFIRRRRDRARLERLRETEPPDEPAYWEEEDSVTWNGGAEDPQAAGMDDDGETP